MLEKAFFSVILQVFLSFIRLTLESIIPNFCLLIFAVKLECLQHEKKYAFAMKWQSFI